MGHSDWPCSCSESSQGGDFKLQAQKSCCYLMGSGTRLVPMIQAEGVRPIISIHLIAPFDAMSPTLS